MSTFKYINYISSLILLLGVGMLYDRFKSKYEMDDNVDEYFLIKKYLLNESSLANSKKPLLWIHIEHDVNSRNWESFGSRTNTNLNQPYQFLTISSIINRCGDSFNIVIIDDNTFNKIIPGWSHDLSSLPDPIKSHFRQLALARTLYLYGGLLVPSSFICIKDLIMMYNDNISTHGLFFGEFVNKSVTCDSTKFFTSNKLMGCSKDNQIMAKLINHIEILISQDYTDEVEFNGKIQQKCNDLFITGEAGCISASQLGVKTDKGEIVTIEDLFGNSFIKFTPKLYGVYIPADEILKRTNYEWFARMNPEQILQSNTIVGKLLLTNSNM